MGLDALFSPRAVAVVGASNRELTIGYRIIENLLDFGFGGPVYPVNPKGGEIRGLGAFRHVQCETLREDWPERRAEADRRIRAYVEFGSGNDGRVIVVPFRIAGFGPYADVLAGLRYVADEKGLCPHPNMTRWIEQTAEECLATR